MSLYESILKTLGVATTDLPCQYRITLCGDFGAHVEGVKKIIDVTNQKVIFEVKNGKIIIEGNNLKLLSFIYGDATLKGEILKVVKE
ncbi:MAG: YabP/YqfC family sporulation protein [Clostridia bacterium]|nr:YabP/YqfC family sporulation protein [Clostridia bacterium]